MAFPTITASGQTYTSGGVNYISQLTPPRWKINSLTVSVASTDITDSTAAGRSLLTAATVAAQRTALGLATVASTGAYTDLTGTPALATQAEIQAGTAVGTDKTVTVDRLRAALGAGITSLSGAPVFFGEVSRAGDNSTAIKGTISGSGDGNGVAGAAVGSGSGNGVYGLKSGSGAGAGVTSLHSGTGAGNATSSQYAGAGSGHASYAEYTTTGGGSAIVGFTTAAGSGHGIVASIIGGGSGYAGYFGGNVYASGTITQLSDRRLKSDIVDITTTKASAVLALPIYTFQKHRNGQQNDRAMGEVMDRQREDVARMTASLATLTGEQKTQAEAHIATVTARIAAWDAEEWLPLQDKPERRSIGIIAQDLQAVAPELTTTDADGIIGVNDIATLYAMIAGLKAEIATLKAKA